MENTQRDVNIALVNELSLIFNRLGIDTHEVLDAAGTKWNFLPFRPGLVGGHCIGVDPYYLTHKAQETGYNPEMILAGRRINDNMGLYVVGQVVKLMLRKQIQVMYASGLGKPSGNKVCALDKGSQRGIVFLIFFQGVPVPAQQVDKAARIAAVNSYGIHRN